MPMSRSAKRTRTALHQQQVRTVRFLAEKLIDDLENPAKILVFRQNEPLSAGDLVDLRIALSASRPEHPAMGAGGLSGPSARIGGGRG